MMNKRTLLISLFLLFTICAAYFVYRYASYEKINIRLQQLHDADQQERYALDKDNSEEAWDTITKNDVARRQIVEDMIKNNELVAPIDFYHAAMIFQHGSTLDDIWQAHTLAKKAAQLGYDKAKWLTAASYDRWLMYQKKPQKYGTQYTDYGQGVVLYKYDPETTDDERKQMNVPPLEEALEMAQRFSKAGILQPKTTD